LQEAASPEKNNARNAELGTSASSRDSFLAATTGMHERFFAIRYSLIPYFRPRAFGSEHLVMNNP
jgi:hypothetical protein